jgi:hypothetical protein
VVGMTVLLIGIALLVLPGPAILVIPAGLAILGLEFRWARRWMRRAKALIQSGETRFFRRNSGQVSRSEAVPGTQANADRSGRAGPGEPTSRDGAAKVESVAK